MKEQRINKDIDGSPKSAPANRECIKCENLKEQLSEINKEFENLKSKLEEANSSRNELQTNMVDLVKTMDKKKLQDSEAQNKATLKFVDDAKETLRKELERTHQGQVQKLETEIEKLRGELLYTKEEYVRLCEDMKNLEHQVQQNIQNESKLELEEMKLQMENEFQEKLKFRENELSMKYIEDLDKEKQTWHETAAHEMQVEVERSVALAQTEWLAQHNRQKEQEIASALQLGKLEWEHEMKSKSEARESDLEALKVSWENQKEVCGAHCCLFFLCVIPLMPNS